LGWYACGVPIEELTDSLFVTKPAVDNPARRALLATIPSFIAFLSAVLLTARARGVPDNDYWDMISSVIHNGKISFSLGDLYKQSNEHIVLISKLLYILNYYIAYGNNVGLSIIACIFSLIVGVSISVLLARSTRTRVEAVVVGVVAAVFCFPTLAAHNFFMGMSGIAWIGANLFSVCAAIAFWKANDSEWKWGYGLALLFAVLAAHSYSTGLVATCVLGIQGLAAPKSRRIGAVLLGLGLLLIFVVYLFQTVPPRHADRATDIVEIASFCFTFLGGSLFTSITHAMVAGVIGALVFAALAWQSLLGAEKGDNLRALWISIGAYAVLNSGLAAIGRANMGGDAAALASRYATVPAYFWIGLFGLAISTPQLRKIRFAPQACLALGLIAAMISLTAGTARLDKALERAKGKDLATLALSLGVRDPGLMIRSVTPAYSQYEADAPDLRALGHVPFDKRDFGCPELGSVIEYTEAPDDIIGYLDAITNVKDEPWYRIRGWVASRARTKPPLLKSDLFGRYACIAFIDPEGTVIGVGLGGQDRPDVGAHLHRSRDDFGWSGYVSDKIGIHGSQPLTVHAAIRDPSSSQWIRMSDSIDLGRPVEKR
jgi:hypothetical protein